MLQDTEGDLIEPVLAQVPLQILRPRDLGLIGQRRSGFDRLRLPPAARVVLLKRDPPRIDLRVTLPAPRLIAMLLEPLPQRQSARILIERGHVRRRIRRRLRDDPPRQPRSALDRI